MTRLQKKCLVASTGVHALLCLILLVGPAFLVPKDRVEDLPVINLVSAKLVDDALSGGGGNPNAAPPAALPPKPLVRPEPVRVEPKLEPAPPKPVERHETRKPRPEPEPPEERLRHPDATPEPTTKPKSTKHVIQPSFTLKQRTPAENKAKLQAEAKMEEQARVKAIETARLEALNSSMNKLRENLSSGTAIEMPGPGGEAYANYGQFVRAMYYDAWIPPEDATEDSSIVQVQVIISRSGDVISSKVLQKSGTKPLDRSVQKALDRVRFVAPFPEGAKDDQRIFKLNFNLKAKRQLG